jgi:hypothetical protein
MILSLCILLLLIWPQMLMLLEPCEVHGFPLFVPGLLQVLRGTISRCDLGVSSQLVNSSLFVVIEDSIASPDVTEGRVEVLRLRVVIAEEGGFHFMLTSLLL